MKKLFSIVLALVLTFALAACGCQATDPVPATTVPTTIPATTAPTTIPTTAPTTVPPMDPSMETNIPDPSVDTSVPDMTEDTTDQTEESSLAGNEGRMRMR